MINRAWIHHEYSYPATVSGFCALKGFRMRGIRTEPFYSNPIKVQPTDIVVGSRHHVHSALEFLGVRPPLLTDYPDDLEEIAGFRSRRNLRYMSLGIARSLPGTFFLKSVAKGQIPGFVWKGTKRNRDLLSIFPNNTTVWVMDRIQYLSEYRCFVSDGDIVSIRHCKGNEARLFDFSVVRAAVESYTHGPASYTIDFGVTRWGTTVVNVNDAYAVDSCGLDPMNYSRFLLTRWEELVENLPAQP